MTGSLMISEVVVYLRFRCTIICMPSEDEDVE